MIPAASQTAPGFQLPQAFERPAPVVVEVGFGVGDALARLAAIRPDCNVVGFEVWQPGVADCLAALAVAGVSNARLSTLDAAWCFANIIAPATVTEIWTFFPDPWPRARHHKRRLVDPKFAALAASRLAPGGVWRLATDWPHYAEKMQAVLDAEPTLRGGITDRYADRPLTRFERRGIAAGRPITDLTYLRSA
ncbi:MAG TPA: tRNA (guanosine(46)-N7)-methyltransferase TrmB [Mycobacteriales bacterium]|nr:tRNA (guanosine(46)-N7)-methyltransferase TrmB [Mycobacteriales bacterium]